jgi:hypothetical protein
MKTFYATNVSIATFISQDYDAVSNEEKTMLPDDVIEHFGGRDETMAALGVSRQVLYQWIRREHVPMGRQWQIQALTKGRLKVAETKEKAQA